MNQSKAGIWSVEIWLKPYLVDKNVAYKLVQAGLDGFVNGCCSSTPEPEGLVDRNKSL